MGALGRTWDTFPAHPRASSGSWDNLGHLSGLRFLRSPNTRVAPNSFSPSPDCCSSKLESWLGLLGAGQRSGYPQPGPWFLPAQRWSGWMSREEGASKPLWGRPRESLSHAGSQGGWRKVGRLAQGPSGRVRRRKEGEHRVGRRGGSPEDLECTSEINCVPAGSRLSQHLEAGL